VISAPAIITYPSSSVVGGTVPVSTVCSPPSGSTFPAGSTSVSCTATDARARAAACSFTVTVTVPAPRIEATRYVAFGDSITEGKPGPAAYDPGASQFRDAYAEVLYNLLVQRYSTQEIHLVDRGIGGEQVRGGRPPDGVTRLPFVLRMDAPHVLLLQEGANDLNAGGAAAIPAVVDGLRTMIREARGRGVVVFLGTLLPQRESGRNGGRAALIPVANSGIRAVAASEGAILVDLYEAFGGSPNPWIDADGLHPNAMGYRKMAETFFAAIQRRFEIAPALPSVEFPGRAVWVP
jgi:lysophospholipase L1-like esterase